jgi:hypothetical protein
LGESGMETPEDAFAPESPLSLAPSPIEDDAARDSLFQEINERRARVENAELLHHLRGL